MEVIEFFYPPSEFQKELFKMALQFGGAMFIAWCAVRWALGRFKSEKMWERRTSALADILTALREMDRIYSNLLHGYLTQTDNDFPGQQRRLDAAVEKFTSVSGVAILLLPKPIAAIIERTEASLSERPEDYFSYLDQRSGAISKAVKEIVAAAQKYDDFKNQK